MRMTVVSFKLFVNIFGLVIFLEVGFCLCHALLIAAMSSDLKTLIEGHLQTELNCKWEQFQVLRKMHSNPFSQSLKGWVSFSLFSFLFADMLCEMEIAIT